MKNLFNPLIRSLIQKLPSDLIEIDVRSHSSLQWLSTDDHTHYLKEKASGGIAIEVPTHTHQNADNCGQLDHGLALTGLSDDDHPQYRLESENHSHQSSGMQAGQLDHGLALTGLADDDHPQYRLESENHTHQSSGLQGGQIDHGASLVGLGDDDHGQYVANTIARTISAVHTFNPGVAGAPFSLGANAIGQLVTGLNADLVDGQHRTLTINTDHTHQSSGTQGGTLDHGLALTGLLDDDHTQYTRHGGRTGGQIQYGGIDSGNSIYVRSTVNPVKGNIILGDDGGNVVVGGTIPIARFHSFGTIRSDGGLLVQGISTPGIPAVDPQGTPEITTWSYRISARSWTGETLAGVAGTTTSGNSVLSAVNLNRISWSAVAGAAEYRIYRTVAGGTPSSTGLIGSTTNLTFNDTGLAASGAVPTIGTSDHMGIGLPLGTIASQKLTIYGTAGSPATSGVTQNGIFRIINGSTNSSFDFGQMVGSPFSCWIQGANVDNLSVNRPIALNPNGGNVGIGTLSPAARLTLVGNDDINRVRFSTTDTTVGFYQGIEFENAGGFRGGIFMRHDTNQVVIFSSIAQAIIISSSNLVGINNPNPQTNLDIIGNVKLQQARSTTSGVIFKGTTVFIHDFVNPTLTGIMGNNTFVGEGCGDYFYAGIGATAVFQGSYNTALGAYSLRAVTLGYYNTAIGFSALPGLTNGYFNLAVGAAAMLSETTGAQNVGVGVAALHNMQGATNCVGVGMNAGRYLNDGSTALTAAHGSVFIGSDARGHTNSETYSIVIGHQALGLGSYTTVIGTVSQTTLTVLHGNLRLPKAAGFASEIDNGNSGTSKTIDWNSGNKQRITMNGNCTFTFTAPNPAVIGDFTLRIIQDGTGSRTAVWPTSVKWAGGTPTLSTAANAVDIANFYWNGTNYFGTLTKNFT